MLGQLEATAAVRSYGEVTQKTCSWLLDDVDSSQQSHLPAGKVNK